MIPQFSQTIPKLQQLWDNSSFLPLMECAKKYELSILEGWALSGESVHLDFGRISGEALELFFRKLIAGGTHDDAVAAALQFCIERTWAGEGPTLGRFEPMWKCTGVTPYKNAKGNKAKCPFAHEGKWQYAPGPETCSCGSPTFEKDVWHPLLVGKDRLGLLRLVFAYTEDVKGAALQPIVVEGEPLLEMHWQVPFSEVQGHRFWLCGNLDKVASLGGLETFITDYKTTKNTLGGGYWKGFWPNLQVGMYDLVSVQILPPGLEGSYSGIMIEAFQTLEHGVRIGRQVYHPTVAERDELMRDLHMYLVMAKTYAEVGYYPRNRTACKLCQFQPVCAAPPHQREHILAERYVRGWWDPVKRERVNAAPWQNATLSKNPVDPIL